MKREMKEKDMNLKNSEIKKIEKAFLKETGRKAYMSGYGAKWSEDFTEARCEMTYEDEDKYAGEVIITIVMFDRRRSWISGVFENK